MNPRLKALFDRVNDIELTPRQRQLLTWVGYPLFALMVALITFYVSVPRQRVKERLETALSADVTSGQPLAIGMDVEIGDLSLTLFTGLGFKATDIILHTRPINPGEKPARYLIDDVRVRLGLLSTVFGRPSYSFTAHALSGTVSGHVSGNNDETKARIEIEKLVLNGVPGIQQSLGGLPLDGNVSGKLDVSVPKNLLANANGGIDVDIDDLAIGDGKAKLTVPNDPFLSAGVTFPRIRLGKLAGQIAIEKGRAKLEGVRVHSADGDATLEGYVELRDPIAMSQVHVYLKFRPSEALIKREPTVELLNNAMASAKRSDGFIGIQLTGSLGGVFFLPSKDPPFGVTTRSEPGTGTMAPPAVAAPPPPVMAPPPAQPPPSPPPSEPSGATTPPTGTGALPAPPIGPPAVAPGAVPSGPPGAPAEGGKEVGAPPPGSGATVAPPPALRQFRAEPPEQPAKTE